MNKGWYVKVDTQVVFNIDTNIGVVAPDQVKAGIRAQELIERYLDSDAYKAELEKELPWELEMGGLNWNRGSCSAEIDFDTMQSVSVTPDSDFDPDEDEGPRSECCGATLLHYDNVLGLCAECKEWSEAYQDEPLNEEEATTVRGLMEAAQCLNECYYSTAEDHPLREWQACYGISEVREQINLCAVYCEQVHRLMMDEQGYDGCFDLDFCPQFLENCVDHGTFKPKSENLHVLSMYWSGIGA